MGLTLHWTNASLSRTESAIFKGGKAKGSPTFLSLTVMSTTVSSVLWSTSSTEKYRWFNSLVFREELKAPEELHQEQAAVHDQQPLPSYTSVPQKAGAARRSVHSLAAEFVTAEPFPSPSLRPHLWAEHSILMKCFIFWVVFSKQHQVLQCPLSCWGWFANVLLTDEAPKKALLSLPFYTAKFSLDNQNNTDKASISYL